MTVDIQRIDASERAWLIKVVEEANLTSEEEQALRQCLRLSVVCWIGLVDKKVACVWGLVPPSLMSNQAYLWLLTARLAEEHTFLLVRHSQIMVGAMLKEFDSITGHCHVDATRSIRWIGWLGGRFGKPTDKGVPFVIRKPNG